MELVLYWVEVLVSFAILLFVIMSFIGTYQDYRTAQQLESDVADGRKSFVLSFNNAKLKRYLRILKHKNPYGISD